MKRTHLSLYYLVGYLIPSGLALLFAPGLAFQLLLSNSNGAYGDVLPRLAGGILLALGLLVFQIVRHRVEQLYVTIIYVRLILLGILVGLFLYSRDPLFISLFVVVGIGVVLTTLSYIRDRQSQKALQG